ncbi:MAG TPA: DUF4398 domain-containing protein [Polyangia bacterium]|nr:DUF4398 domain-containing protein [Polyangia bacterium]
MRPARAGLLALATFGLLANACAATAVPAPLVLARLSFERVSKSPAAAVAPRPIEDARMSLAKANQEFATNGDTGICRDYAYIVENELEAAEAAERAELARRALGE